jgi:hypothetical protein
MRYTPSECPKCGTSIARSSGGGRPSRWCSEGCKRSGEAEMSRLQWALRSWEEGDRESRFNNHHISEMYKDGHERRMAIISEMQARYDHLAGVPDRSSDD